MGKIVNTKKRRPQDKEAKRMLTIELAERQQQAIAAFGFEDPFIFSLQMGSEL